MHKDHSKVSIIFPVKNEGSNVKKTLNSLFSTATNIKYEVIIVDDASDDGCCDFLEQPHFNNKVKKIRTMGVGPSVARNIGAESATSDYLMFCDAHLTFQPLWIDKLLTPLKSDLTDVVCPAIASMDDQKIVGFGQTLNSSLRIQWHKKRPYLFHTAIIPGGCFLIKRDVFFKVGGFETGFKTWGHEDVELSIKLWLFGYRCSCEPSVTILHLFRKSHPYKVDYDGVYYNLLRMAYLHFDQERIKKTKDLIIHRSPKKIESLVLKDGVEKRRREYFQKRVYNDEWYFKHFKIHF
ncbi:MULTISPECIES: glycosyltransferase [Bacillaceae]|uniref:glycosyltransferase n=1 Tax=Bacillaceae TaxID=186817 RepID=UPI001C582B7F|nr:glycosyltransferase [Rossellomorea sp. YZS02]MBW3113778.1 glycosyltransferase [Bacillus sp. MCCB 382]MDX8343979.1 glycosyltransferase [Rossellomorea sp. YZS02]